MDFSAQRTEHTAAVLLGGGFSFGVVLRGGTGEGRELAIDAVDRRAIHTDAVLRNSEDGLVARRARLCGQRETGTRAGHLACPRNHSRTEEVKLPFSRRRQYFVASFAPTLHSAKSLGLCAQSQYSLRKPDAAVPMFVSTSTSSTQGKHSPDETY